MLVPAESAQGGISNYFQVLKNRFSSPVEYFERGARSWPIRKSKLAEIIRAWKDLQAFKQILDTGDYGLVQTSTSLGSFAVIRDGFFIYLAKLRGIKVIVFFRGWDERFESILESRYLRLFKSIFFQADAMIVLASAFKNRLRAWGYTKPVYIETTVVDDTLVSGIDQAFLEKKYTGLKDEIRLLFLARVEREKGIYEAIDAFAHLSKAYPKLSLIIAGDGFELQPAQEYVKSKCIERIFFIGKVIGEAKRRAFLESHIYLFPSYTEGLPNSVLEAMAFGLPILATRVGGLNDILQDGRTGYFIHQRDSQDIAQKIELLLNDLKLTSAIALYNHSYAINNFNVGIVVRRLEVIYQNYLKEIV